MFKRYSQYSSGTCCQLVISWPKGISAKGEIRNQYYHSVDIVPTVLDICGLKMPDVYHGVKQYPLSGVSLLYLSKLPGGAGTFPTQKKSRYKKHSSFLIVLYFQKYLRNS
jgi:arylsulfatase